MPPAVQLKRWLSMERSNLLQLIDCLVRSLWLSKLVLDRLWGNHPSAPFQPIHPPLDPRQHWLTFKNSFNIERQPSLCWQAMIKGEIRLYEGNWTMFGIESSRRSRNAKFPSFRAPKGAWPRYGIVPYLMCLEGSERLWLHLYSFLMLFMYHCVAFLNAEKTLIDCSATQHLLGEVPSFEGPWRMHVFESSPSLREHHGVAPTLSAITLEAYDTIYCYLLSIHSRSSHIQNMYVTWNNSMVERRGLGGSVHRRSFLIHFTGS